MTKQIIKQAQEELSKMTNEIDEIMFNYLPSYVHEKCGGGNVYKDGDEVGEWLCCQDCDEEGKEYDLDGFIEVSDYARFLLKEVISQAITQAVEEVKKNTLQCLSTCKTCEEARRFRGNR